MATRSGGTALVFRDPATGASDLTAAVSLAAPLAGGLSDSQRRGLIALCTHLRLLFQRFDLQDLPRSRKRAQLASLALQWGLVSERDL